MESVHLRQVGITGVNCRRGGANRRGGKVRIHDLLRIITEHVESEYLVPRFQRARPLWAEPVHDCSSGRDRGYTWQRGSKFR